MEKPSVVLGRALNNEIVLDDQKTSRVHARFDWNDGVCTVSDMGSRNGTWVNGEKVETASLSSGDSVVVGDTKIRVEIVTPQSMNETLMFTPPDDLMQTMIVQPTIAVALNNTTVPRLAIQALGETWEMEIKQDNVTIGRAPTNDISIDSEAVSRNHAQIQHRREGFVLVDRNSTNGTHVHGSKILEHRLKDGDSFQVGPAQIVFKDSFTSADLTRESMTGVPTGLPSVIFIPGIMGSELYQGSSRIWPDFKTLFNTRGNAMKLDKYPDLEARGLVNEVVMIPGLFKADVYGRLGDYLVESLGYERGRDLFEFPYDWRQDNRVTARKLAAQIDAWDIKGPIVIVAHSMGSLISRYYIENLGGKRRIARLFQMGAPLRGSVRTIDILMTGKGIIPMGIGAGDLRATVATFPSMYQLLPSTDCVFDDQGNRINILEQDEWVAEEFRPHVHSARDFAREVPLRSSISTVCIFGYGLNTATNVHLTRNRSGQWQRLAVAREASGDTVVSENSSVLPDTEIHPVKQPHGTLFLDNDVKMRLKIELTKPYV